MAQIAVVGAGIIGRTAAWHLQRCGHQVALIDPHLDGDPEGGSSAALGLLMAQVFHRASGRAWRLRQRSLALWEQWIPQLQALGHGVSFRRGLLLLASDPDEAARQQALVAARQAMGLPLTLWDRARVAELDPPLPASFGALWSGHDGQIDPLPLLRALLSEVGRLGASLHTQAATTLQAKGHGRWQLDLVDGTRVDAQTVVICAGAGTAALLQGLGIDLPLAPVLGQALELCSGFGQDPWTWSPHWPAAVVWRGVNLVPRANGQLWLGATLEPGSNADPACLEALAGLHGLAPAWLLQAQRLRQWQGLRMQPQGRGAPWLEQLQPGLLLAGGHYRNGLLLAPATAEWIAQSLTDS